MVEIAVLVAVALHEQLEQRVAQSGVHPNALAGVVAADAVAREALLEECLVVRAPAVQESRGRIARREHAPLAPRVVPRAQRVTRAIQRAEDALARVGAHAPLTLERRGRRCIRQTLRVPHRERGPRAGALLFELAHAALQVADRVRVASAVLG